MSDDNVRKVLKDFGLTESESEIYIFLSKYQALKGGDIAKSLHIQKGQVYRSLKGLQSKAIVELTLESPARFMAVPFETVLDLLVKTKREEASAVERTRRNSN